MNLEKLLVYDFAKGFVEGKLTEDVFLAELFKKVRTNKNFRADTGVISLETKDLNEVVDELKKYSKRKYQTRRGIIKTIAAGITASVIGLKGSPSITEASNQSYIDPKILYRELLKIPEVKPKNNPIFSGNPDAPIIILVQDQHKGEDTIQGWRREFTQLELLRTKFGLNFVGIEGWAGHEVDRKRKRVLLHAEDGLIKRLMNNKNYETIGLEDNFLQVRFLEMAHRLPYLCVKHNCLTKEIEMQLNKVGTLLKSIRIFFAEAFSIFDERDHEAEIDLENKNLECLKIATEDDTELWDKIKENEKIKYFTEQFLKNLNIISNRFGYIYGIKKINVAIIKFKELELVRGLGPFQSISCNAIYKDTSEGIFGRDISFRNNFMLYTFDYRDQFAIERMLNYMISKNKKIGIIVFGISHIEGLVKKMIEATNNSVSIIVLENPAEYQLLR